MGIFSLIKLKTSYSLNDIQDLIIDDITRNRSHRTSVLRMKHNLVARSYFSRQKKTLTLADTSKACITHVARPSEEPSRSCALQREIFFGLRFTKAPPPLLPK